MLGPPPPDATDARAAMVSETDSSSSDTSAAPCTGHVPTSSGYCFWQAAHVRIDAERS
jgi:hypothetical protein